MLKNIGSWELIFRECLLFSYDDSVEVLGYRNWSWDGGVSSNHSKARNVFTATLDPVFL